MKKSIELLLSYIFLGELFDHVASVIRMIRSSTIVDEALTGFTDKLAVFNNKLKVALKRERKSAYTTLIKSLDRDRDNWFKCFKGHVIADVSRPDIAFSNAADRIYQILKNHGLRLHYKSYEQESALLESLFEELDAETRQADIQKLGLVEVYEALKKAQIDFKTAYLERITVESGEDDILAASMEQKNVKEALEDATDYVNLMTKSNPAIYKELALTIDTLEEKMNRKIRTRRSAAQDEDVKDRPGGEKESRDKPEK